MEKLTGLLLLLAALNVALAQETPTYFKDGGVLTMELRPRPPKPLTSIVWKFNGDLLAEWVKDALTGAILVPLEYYRNFKGRTTLDLTSGRLVINNMAKADMGVYSVEVNNQVQNVQYKTVMIQEVPQPVVEPRPLTCSPAADSCTLTCDADTTVLTDAGPVTYSWKKGDGEWKASVKDLNITKEGTLDVKTFTCRIQNPVSVKESKPADNPLLDKKPESPGLPWWAVAAIILVSLLALIVIVMGVLRYFKIFLFTNLCATSPDATGENGQSKSATSGENTVKAGETEEGVPLNDTPEARG